MISDILLYLAVGVAGGIVNTAAGGAKLFVFPLLLATGLSPLAANATVRLPLDRHQVSGQQDFHKDGLR